MKVIFFFKNESIYMHTHVW